jgi:hypothetical protein
LLFLEISSLCKFYLFTGMNFNCLQYINFFLYMFLYCLKLDSIQIAIYF